MDLVPKAGGGGVSPGIHPPDTEETHFLWLHRPLDKQTRQGHGRKTQLRPGSHTRLLAHTRSAQDPTQDVETEASDSQKETLRAGVSGREGTSETCPLGCWVSTWLQLPPPTQLPADAHLGDSHGDSTN